MIYHWTWFLRAQVDPLTLFDAPIQKQVTDRAVDIEVSLKKMLIYKMKKKIKNSWI